MRWLVWAVAGAAVLWGGLWFAMATALNRGAEGAFAAMAARGVLAERSDVSVMGFPNRLDLTVTAPRLGDPATGAVWSAPFVQLITLTWKPWHVIAAFPPEQRLTLPGAALDLSNGRLQASLVLRPRASLPLDRLALAGDALAFTLAAEGMPDRTLAIDTLRLATRPDPTRALTHEIGLDVAGIAPDPAVIAALPVARRLPPAVERLRLVAFAGLTAPLDRHAAETRPALAALDLSEASLDWGPIRLRAEGRLVPDAEGLAEGRIDIRLTDWPAALDAAVAAGLIRPEIAPTWAELARRLAAASPDPDTIDLPLAFGRGRMSLGPLPLGPAPRLLPAPQG